MGDRETGERYVARGELIRKAAETCLQPTGKPLQPCIGAERIFETGKSRRGAGSPEREIEPARETAENLRGETAGSERVLQRGQQRHRSQTALGKLEDEAEKSTGRRPAQRNASRIVDRDAPALKLGGHASRQLAIGGDKRGGGARCLQLAAQQECDRHRLLLRAGTIEAGEPGDRIGGLRRQAPPCVGGGRRPQCFADQPYPSRTRALPGSTLRAG